MPCSVFGLSPLVLSYLIAYVFRDGDELAILPMLLVTAVGMGAVNLFSAFGISRLATGHATSPKMAAGEAAPLLGERATDEPISLRAFLADPATWLLGFALLLATSPGDMILASFGGIVQAIDSPPDQRLDLAGTGVVVLSLTNTLARLGVGALTDRVSPRLIGRPTVLALAAAMMAAVWLWASAGMSTAADLVWMSALTGLGYGTSFILVPTCLSVRYGASSMARSASSHAADRADAADYGIIAYFAAVGASIYTLLYGVVADAHSSTPLDCVGRACFALTFQLSAAGGALAAIICLVLARRPHWRGRV